MAETNNNRLSIVLLIFIVYLAYQGGFFEKKTELELPDITPSVEDVTVSFAAIDRYVPSNKLTSELARVFVNGYDEGYIALSGGTTSEIQTSPKDEITAYFALNSTEYYVDKKTETAPNKGTLKIQGTPTKWGNLSMAYYNEHGNPETAPDIDTSPKTIGIRYRSTYQTGFGNPDAPDGKGVAICFHYNDTYSDVSVVGLSAIGVPSSIDAAYSKAGGFVISCYEGHSVANGGERIYDVEVTPASGRNPTAGNNINVSYEDKNLYFDDDGNEKWGYEDQDNNDLGTDFKIDSISIASG